MSESNSARKRGGAGDKPQKKPSWQRRLWREVRGYAEALVIAYLVVTFLFTTVGVVGSSMEPTLNGGVGSSNVLRSLLTGDRVFIPKYDTWLRRIGVLGPYPRGTIVVLREPANAPTALETGKRNFFIKRVIARPGDHYRVVNGQVYINDTAINQSWITRSGQINVAPVDYPEVIVRNGKVADLVMGFDRTPDGTPVPMLPSASFQPQGVPVNDPRVQLFYGKVVSNIDVPPNTPEDTPTVLDMTVPKGYYIVQGDNRSSGGSEDSRYFGPVKAITIAGEATAVIWPPVRNGKLNWRGLGPPAAFAKIPNHPPAK
ncbi:MAG TPA: signal peptidase I [Trueperaceae bacterium]|nr:signal peptidase I [Trueperaceae bacterium]